MLPQVNVSPPGKPERLRSPETMVANQELWQLFEQHYAVPKWPDGECVCGEYSIDGQADHLVHTLVEHFGLPWTREEEKHVPDIDEPLDVETADEVLVIDYPKWLSDTLLALAADEAKTTTSGPISLYEVRYSALDAALRLQENVEDYANADTLIYDAEAIYKWLTTDFV